MGFDIGFTGAGGFYFSDMIAKKYIFAVYLDPRYPPPTIFFTGYAKISASRYL